VVTPADMLEQHGSDAVRYWAASSRLGTDAAFDPQNPTQIKIGRRLAIKVLNASKFILGFDVPAGNLTDAITHPLDLSMLATLRSVVAEATLNYDNYDHARALEVAESFFWTFTDDYLELVKERAYNSEHPHQASAAAALRLALTVLLRMFAPVLPFATDESWSWFNEGSIHRASWPSVDEFPSEGDTGVLVAASAALIGIRRAKTDAKASQKTDVLTAVIAVPHDQLSAIEQAAGDLAAVGRIASLSFTSGDEIGVASIDLAPQED
jgi:valyl-tRNA synthetase